MFRDLHFVANFSPEKGEKSEKLSTKCRSLRNEPHLARPIRIDLNPYELYYYPFTVIWDRCNGSCNILDDSFSRICVPNKIESINLNGFNIIARINALKTLTKHLSCEFKSKVE